MERLSGRWHNQLGTSLVVTVNEDGFITGHICSPVGGVQGEHPVIGYLAALDERRGVLGLVAAWRGTNSITTWSGHYDLDDEVIAASWLLTGADFGENEWQSTRLGHDVFRPGRVPDPDGQDRAGEGAGRSPG